MDGDDNLFRRRELSNEYEEYALAIVTIDHLNEKKLLDMCLFS